MKTLSILVILVLFSATIAVAQIPVPTMNSGSNGYNNQNNRNSNNSGYNQNRNGYGYQAPGYNQGYNNQSYGYNNRNGGYSPQNSSIPAPTMNNGGNGYSQNRNGYQNNGYSNGNQYPGNGNRNGNQQYGGGYPNNTGQQPSCNTNQRPTSTSCNTNQPCNTPTDRRRVAIEFQYVAGFYDDYGQYLKALDLWWLESYVKQEALSQNLDVVVWGESFDRTNAANDQITGSGRYQCDTIPAQGVYQAPSQLFIVKVRSWSKGLDIVVNGYGAGMCTAHVELTLEVNDLAHGLTKQVLVTDESAKGLQSILALQQGVAFSAGNIDNTLTGRAARKAVEKVLSKIKESAN